MTDDSTRRPSRAELRLLPPALAAWGTVWLSVTGFRAAAALAAGAVAVGVVAIVLVICTTAARRPGSARRAWLGAVLLCCTTIALGCAVTAMHLPGRHPAALEVAVAGHRFTANATVSTQPVSAEPPLAAAISGDSGGNGGGGAGGVGDAGRVRFHAVIHDLTVGDTRISGRIPALVFASGSSLTAADIGASIALSGSARVLPSSEASALMVYASDVSVVREAPASLAWAERLREGFRTASEALPGDGGELLPGLAIGDVSRVGPELDTAMKTASLSHLTAVSGSNCALIIAGGFVAASALGLPRRLRAGVALALLLGFVILVTPGASVLRAAVMAVVLVLGGLLGRPSRAMPGLCLAVIGLLVWDPWMARDYGFALSVLATGGLLLLAPPLTDRLAGVMPRKLAAALALPTAAQLACQPVLILLDPGLPVYGVVANMLAEPAAPVATVLGLVACVAAPLAPWLGGLLAWLAWPPSAWIAAVARASADAPGASAPWLGGTLGMLLTALCVAAICLLVVRTNGRAIVRTRRVVTSAAVLAVVALAATSAGTTVARAGSRPSDWTIGMCDVGQGDAIVLHSRDEKGSDQYGLVDTGAEPELLTSCLDFLGIHHLALLVLTHFDNDHVGASEAVAGITGTALVGHPDGARADRRVAQLRANGVDVRVPSRGTSGMLGSLRWDVLWPDESNRALLTGNQGSITMRFTATTGPPFSALTLADMNQLSQAALLRDGGLGPMDVVKVGHHGSADQEPRLYETLRARIGLISAGAGNRYGHPSDTALRLLRDTNALPVRTDLEGISLITVSDDGALSVWTQRASDESSLWKPARGGNDVGGRR